MLVMMMPDTCGQMYHNQVESQWVKAFELVYSFFTFLEICGRRELIIQGHAGDSCLPGLDRVWLVRVGRCGLSLVFPTDYVYAKP